MLSLVTYLRHYRVQHDTPTPCAHADFEVRPSLLPGLLMMPQGCWAFKRHLNNTVSAVESFRFLGSTISQNLKWEPNINRVIKKAQQRMYNMPQELLIQFNTLVIESDPSLSGLDLAPNWTGTDDNGQSGLQKILKVPTCPPSRTCTPPEPGNGQEKKSLQTPHTLDITCSNFSPLVSATEHRTPKPPDTGTVSSPLPSH